MPIEGTLFGSIDPESDNYWEASVRLDDGKVEVDLNIDDAAISADRVTAALEKLSRADRLARLARTAIATLSKTDDDDPLGLYFRHHRDELTAPTLASSLGLSDVGELSEETLVAGLELRRIGVYPEDDEETFVIDFALPRHATNYLLSVKLDATGTPRVVDMES